MPEILKSKYIQGTDDNLYQMVPPKASATELGGILADPQTDETTPVVISEDGHAYVGDPEGLKDLEARVEEIELFKFPNATIIGEPLIESGNISRFSNANYLIFPFVVDVRQKSFQIDMCFTTGSNVTTQQNVLDSNFGLALAIQNGRGLMAMSSTGSSWDIGVSTGSIVVNPNTTYYARVTWDGSVYMTALSTDGVSYISDMTIASSAGLFPATIYIGGSPDLFGVGSAHPFGGTINLNKCHLAIAGLEIWSGMDDAGMSTRANVSLSNLDEEGEKKLGVKDVQINGVSIMTQDGVVVVPILTSTKPGLIARTNISYGINVNADGILYIYGANSTNIDARSHYAPLTGKNLPYAYKSAATAPVSTTDPAWTEEEQKAAQLRLGILSSEEVLFG